MNCINQIGKAVAKYTDLEDFSVFMDLLINKLEVVPGEKISQEHLENLYFEIENYPDDLPYILHEAEKIEKVWDTETYKQLKKMLHFDNEAYKQKIQMYQKEQENFWYKFIKTGIPPELREKLIATAPKLLSDEKNRTDYDNLCEKLLILSDKANRLGILSLEEDITVDGSDFLTKALKLITNGVEMAIIDEILSADIIREEDIFTQFLKYVTMRCVLYIQSRTETEVIRTLLMF